LEAAGGASRRVRMSSAVGSDSIQEAMDISIAASVSPSPS
jgi:hypothetical protein